MSTLALTITRSHIHGRLIESVDRARADGAIDDWKFRFCALYLTNGRNDCVRHFLTTDHDVMLFVDSDTAFQPEHARRVTKAVSADEPVVCGWYRGILEDGTTVPVVYHGDGEEFFQISEEQLLEGDDDNGLVAVGAAGTGFMAIHRSLLEEMPNHWDAPCEWFAEPVMGGKMIGEDLGFCARVAAMGFPILVDRESKVTHYKEVAL